jgi:protein gp37
MNKSNIEWCDFTWNPLTGCKHGCAYCYARGIATNASTGKAFPKGFEPHERFERLSQPYKELKGGAVFVGSMTDMMGEWWTSEQIQKVIDVCRENDQHSFMWLTKNPARYKDFKWPDNCILGATVTNQDDFDLRVPQILAVDAWRFLSVEPILGPIDMEIYSSIGIHVIIAGCQTGPRPKLADPGWFKSLHEQCEERGIHFFLKKVNKKTALLDGKEYKSLMWELRK